MAILKERGAVKKTSPRQALPGFHRSGDPWHKVEGDEQLRCGFELTKKKIVMVMYSFGKSGRRYRKKGMRKQKRKLMKRRSESVSGNDDDETKSVEWVLLLRGIRRGEG